MCLKIQLHHLIKMWILIIILVIKLTCKPFSNNTNTLHNACMVHGIKYKTGIITNIIHRAFINECRTNMFTKPFKCLHNI